jgi:hypothetical protein
MIQAPHRFNFVHERKLFELQRETLHRDSRTAICTIFFRDGCTSSRSQHFSPATGGSIDHVLRKGIPNRAKWRIGQVTE